MDLVKHSRRLTGALNILAAELKLWGVEPREDWEAATAPVKDGTEGEEGDGHGRDSR